MQFCKFLIDQFAALGGIKDNLDYYLLILFAVIDFQPFTISIHISGRWKGCLFLSLRAQFANDLINHSAVGISTFRIYRTIQNDGIFLFTSRLGNREAFLGDDLLMLHFRTLHSGRRRPLQSSPRTGPDLTHRAFGSGALYIPQ